MQANAFDILLFSGSSHPALAKEIAESIGVELGKVELSRFPDGETSFQIKEGVRGRDTFVIQSVALDPDHYLVELLIMIDALKRASAKTVTAVIPYFGYCRQDRKDKARVPITAKLVANMLEKAGVDRVLTMDLHAKQLQGFFDIPVDDLTARPYLVEAFQGYGVKDPIIVAPDIGSAKLARKYASQLGIDFAIIDKHRVTATEIDVVTLIGNVKGKDVLLADDMCSTGGTLVSAAEACHEKGANRVFASVTHGLFVGDSVEKIEESLLSAVLMSNTIPYTDRLSKATKFKTVSVANLFGQAIQCILEKGSISSLSEIKTEVPSN